MAERKSVLKGSQGKRRHITVRGKKAQFWSELVPARRQRGDIRPAGCVGHPAKEDKGVSEDRLRTGKSGQLLASCARHRTSAGLSSPPERGACAETSEDSGGAHGSPAEATDL